MSDFDLNALIAAVTDEVGPDANDIAAKAQPQIPESEVPGVLRMLLARYIVTTRPRLADVLRAPAARPAPPAPSPKFRSAKVAAYQAHARLLRLAVPVGDRQTKFMADCSYGDLMEAAERRRRHAADTIAAADEYEALADLVRSHDVERVGDLPSSALDAFVQSRGQVAA